jgi:hypothetical protein
MPGPHEPTTSQSVSSAARRPRAADEFFGTDRQSNMLPDLKTHRVTNAIERRAIERDLADGRVSLRIDRENLRRPGPIARCFRDERGVAEKLIEGGHHAEAGEKLDKALAFYRSVRASRYIRQAEQLLAAVSHEQEEAAQPHV